MWSIAAHAGEGCVSLHHVLGQGLFDKPLGHYLKKKSRIFAALCKRLTPIQDLVLEEIEAFPVPFLDKVQKVFQEVMATIDPDNAYKPWGGVHLVANGDPNQSMKLRRADSRDWAGYESIDYVFQLPDFSEWFSMAVVLTQVYRSTDADYVRFLTEVGDEEITAENEQRLRSRVGLPPPPDCHVYAWSNKEVQKVNEEYLGTVEGPPCVWTATKQCDDGAEVQCGLNNIEDAYAAVRGRLRCQATTPTFIAKEGVDVLLTANVDPQNGLFQGRRGFLQRILHPHNATPEGAFCDGPRPSSECTPLVLWENGTLHAVTDFSFSEAIRDINGQRSSKPLYAVYKIVPLVLGKAMTFSKSIGREDGSIYLHLDCPDIYANLAYIGLSRTRLGWDGLFISPNFDIRALRMDRACRAFVCDLESKADELNVITFEHDVDDRLSAMEEVFSDIDAPLIADLMEADELNPCMTVLPIKIQLKVNRKMRSFVHVVCEPGYVPMAPKVGTFYDMSELPIEDGVLWFRDTVRFAFSTKSKSHPTTILMPSWQGDATVKRRKCAGSMVCSHLTEGDCCQWSVGWRNVKVADEKQCPVHHTLEACQDCPAVFCTYEELNPAEGSEPRWGLLTFTGDGFADEHSHPPWSVAGLSGASKQLIIQEVTANPTITYRKLVTGKALKTRDPTCGSLVRTDPALANVSAVTKLIQKVRKQLGTRAEEPGLVGMVRQAIKTLGDVSYVLTEPNLVRGLTPTVVCATDTQLYFLCSNTHFLLQMLDFTFSETLGVMDCWDNHSIDFDVDITLCLWRVYARAKSAEALTLP